MSETDSEVEAAWSAEAKRRYEIIAREMQMLAERWERHKRTLLRDRD